MTVKPWFARDGWPRLDPRDKHYDEALHAYPCEYCGADGRSLGACCEAWTNLVCSFCGSGMFVEREAGEGPETAVDHCPDCDHVYD